MAARTGASVADRPRRAPARRACGWGRRGARRGPGAIEHLSEAMARPRRRSGARPCRARVRAHRGWARSPRPGAAGPPLTRDRRQRSENAMVIERTFRAIQIDSPPPARPPRRQSHRKLRRNQGPPLLTPRLALEEYSWTSADAPPSCELELAGGGSVRATPDSHPFLPCRDRAHVRDRLATRPISTSRSRSPSARSVVGFGSRRPALDALFRAGRIPEADRTTGPASRRCARCSRRPSR